MHLARTKLLTQRIAMASSESVKRPRSGDSEEALLRMRAAQQLGELKLCDGDTVELRPGQGLRVAGLLEAG